MIIRRDISFPQILSIWTATTEDQPDLQTNLGCVSEFDYLFLATELASELLIAMQYNIIRHIHVAPFQYLRYNLPVVNHWSYRWRATLCDSKGVTPPYLAGLCTLPKAPHRTLQPPPSQSPKQEETPSSCAIIPNPKKTATTPTKKAHPPQKQKEPMKSCRRHSKSRQSHTPGPSTHP